MLAGMDRALRALRVAFHEKCGLLGVKREFREAPQHDGSAHMEFTNHTFHYVVTERGTEQERRSTKDESEALFWLVSDVVFELASEYELRHRVPDEDFRRLMFAKEVELMKGLDAQWGERIRQRIDGILREYPFDDAACARLGRPVDSTQGPR
jgi:hypothetical protein